MDNGLILPSFNAAVVEIRGFGHHRVVWPHQMMAHTRRAYSAPLFDLKNRLIRSDPIALGKAGRLGACVAAKYRLGKCW